jgi:hypothetical protein
VEMTHRGKSGKPKPGFPHFPQRLEIAFAIPTFPRSGFDRVRSPRPANFLALLELSQTTLLSCGNLARNSAFRVTRNCCPAGRLMAGFGVTMNGRI